MRLTDLRPRPAWRREEGFTMVLAIAAMFLVTLMVVAAYSAVQGDQPLVRDDSLQKQAYAAAQAGVQQYLFDLNTNNQFWTLCVPSTSTPTGINQMGSTAHTRTVPGSSNESYAIELIPAAGYSACSTTNPTASMITPAGVGAGSLRIRVTGYAGNVSRTIVAVLRESTFLDYLWFTKYETADPQDQLIYDGCSPTSCPNSSWSTELAKATAQCTQFYASGRLNGTIYGGKQCLQQWYVSGDNLDGPIYTDDALAICGTPSFGGSAADPIMIGAPLAQAETNQGQSACTAGETNKGTVSYNVPQLSPPPTDGSLQQFAQANSPSSVLYGPTCIVLGATSYQTASPPMGSTCSSSGLTWTTQSYPSNGVIYVANSTSLACTLTYDYQRPDYTTDSTDSGCGTAYVSGTYNTPVTIGTANDLVVNGSITVGTSSTALLGLVANGWVRVQNTCASSLGNVTIDAAILSVQHSFTVDSWDQCSSAAGTLTIDGSIAQLFRGSVGKTTNGTVTSGYNKNYTYDSRLQYQEPPDFLDPVTSAWHVVREDECTVNGSTPGTGGPATC